MSCVDFFVVDRNENGSLNIVGLAANSSVQDLVVPATIDGAKVARIAANAFSGNLDLKNVVVEGVLDEVGIGAFARCANLESFKAKGVVSVADRSFEGNAALRYVELGEAVRSVHMHAFTGCNVEHFGVPAFGWRYFAADCAMKRVVR